MKIKSSTFILFLLFSMILPGTFPVTALALNIGDKAPTFKLVGHDGKDYKLEDYKNQWVVLEWFNQDCPFIRKHYTSGNMQRIQGEFTEKKVAWFSINSSAEGKQGYYAKPIDARAAFTELGSNATAILLDPKGEVGHLYEAKTTPHMFVIDPKGLLAYAGAIDDHPSFDPSEIPKSKNFVVEALRAGMAGKKIEVDKTNSYGCPIKY